MTQPPPPFGALTVRLPRILKFASEMSLVEASVTSETRTLTVLEMLSGNVHEERPVLVTVAAATVGFVIAPFVEFSGLTLGTVLLLAQLIAWGLATMAPSAP